MKSEIILDTGPLIALLNSRDPHHRWAKKHWDEIEPPLLTCEAVVSEACFLARRLVNRGPERVLEFVQRGVLDLTFPLVNEIDALVRLVKKYRDVPMSLADACLVRMSELHPASSILTLDRDFTIYRRKRRQRIPLLHPDLPATGSLTADSP